MKHALAITVGLSLMLLARPAKAYDFVTWHCPVVEGGSLCDSVGKAWYKCFSCGYQCGLPAEVDATGQWVAPPLKPCPYCTDWLQPQYVTCACPFQHRFDGPIWQGYNYYRH